MTNDARKAEKNPTAPPPAAEENSLEDGSPGVTPRQDLADDGEVPAKQLHRWTGEGGAYLPTD